MEVKENEESEISILSCLYGLSFEDVYLLKKFLYLTKAIKEE